MKKIKVLWTGGWDSTFRIVELSRQEVVINPIYVCDEGRKSKEFELIAMNNIIKALNKKKETKAKIMPITIINKEDIPKDEEITKAYEIIHAKTHIGIQNEWLARLAKQYPGIEMGTELKELKFNSVLASIKMFGDLRIEDGIGYLDQEKATKEAKLLLGNFSFPIIEKTETDMVKIIKEWGYEDVMKHIWFCHRPISGEPCGFCHPCVLKMKSDMEFLLPEKAQKRFKKYQFLKKVLGHNIADKTFNMYVKIGKIKNRREI